jgi:hypothetical protein
MALDATHGELDVCERIAVDVLGLGLLDELVGLGSEFLVPSLGGL